MAPSTYIWPSGIIVLHNDTCPSGWTQVAVANNKFIRGGSTWGTTGGGTHAHTFTPEGMFSGYWDANYAEQRYGSGSNVVTPSHRHTLIRDAAASSADEPLPPYVGVVLCKKN